VWDYAMRNLAARADRIDYWIRRRTVACPVHTKVDPALQRFVGLAAIGQSLKDQYNALASPMPPQLARLLEQLNTEPQGSLASYLGK
jgi:hypothetical protein